MFEHSDSVDGRYDRETYFEALRALGVDEAKIVALRQFVDQVHPDPGSTLIEFMARAGVELERRERPDEDARLTWAAAAVRHLMSAACDGSFSLHAESSGLRVFPIEGCTPFSREMVIVSIEGHAIGSDGDRGFGEALKRCAQGDPVTIGLEDGTSLNVPCPQPWPPRATPLAFPGS